MRYLEFVYYGAAQYSVDPYQHTRTTGELGICLCAGEVVSSEVVQACAGASIAQRLQGLAVCEVIFQASLPLSLSIFVKQRDYYSDI